MRDLAWFLALGIALAACAGTQKAPAGEPVDDTDSSSSDDLDNFGTGKGGKGQPRSAESSVSVRYERTVEDNWKRAEEEFADENYVVAQKYYSYIRNKFPYSSYSVKAELKLGDCLFKRGRFLEAIDSFQNFIRLHPTHKEVSYAMYKTGVANFEQIPGDWFMIPPSFEKDQAPVREAERALRSFVDRYPNDPNWKDGDRLLKETRQRLVSHERYVADFYKNLDKGRAYVQRLEVIRAQYADVALNDALLAEICGAYVELKDREKAEATLKDLETRFPNSQLLPKAKAGVAAIQKS